MNPWIRRSIQLAENSNYLDQLSAIYQLPTGGLRRPLRPQDRREVERLLDEGDFVGLIRFVLGLQCFPYQEPYLGSIRVDRAVVERNPETVRRISQTLEGMGRQKILDGLEQPKQVNRMLGALFKNSLTQLAYPLQPEQEFLDYNGRSILLGGDKRLKDFCNRVLNCDLSKGPDFVAKTPAAYVVGETKFLTARGGNQDKSFREVLQFIRSNEGNAVRIGILDGVVWLHARGTYGTIRNVDEVALSALLLREFLESLL